MNPYDYDDYDSSVDINTVENGGCSGVSYTRDGAAQEDVDAARSRLEENGYSQNLRGSWEKD